MGPLVPFYFRAFPLFGLVCFGLLHDYTRREEFRFRQLLQQAKNERIEQLQVEKERLAWDQRLAETRSTTRSADVWRGRQVAKQRMAEPLQHMAAAGARAAALSDGDEDAEAGTVASYMSDSIAEAPALAEGCTSSGARGAPLSSAASESCCSELDDILRIDLDSPPSQSIGATSREPGEATREVRLMGMRRGIFGGSRSSGAPSSVKSEDDGSVASVASSSYAGRNGTVEARAREAALWKTLREMGITPTRVTRGGGGESGMVRKG